MAALIFFLCVSAVNVTTEIANDKLTNIGRMVISALYILVSGELHHQAILNEDNYIIAVLSGIIDCVVILSILNHTKYKNMQAIIMTVVFVLIWGIIALTDFLQFKVEVLHPLLAALISGTALSRIIRAEENINFGWLLLGMGGTMLFDAAF